MPSFINADLEVRSSRSLEPLRDAIGKGALELYCGTDYKDGFLATFEIDSGNPTKDAEHLIIRFCDLIESLPEPARQLWNSASTRTVDLGYQSDTESTVAKSLISTRAMNKMKDLSVELAITVYPLEENITGDEG